MPPYRSSLHPRPTCFFARQDHHRASGAEHLASIGRWYPDRVKRPSERHQLLLGGRLRRRVPRLPIQLQRQRFRAARHRGRGQAWPRRGQRAGRRRDRRPGRARRRGPIDEPRSPLGRYLVRHWERISLVDGESLVYWLRKLVFRGAWLDHRVKESLLEVVWDEDELRVRLPRPQGGRALLELAPVPSWHELQFRSRD